MVDPWPDGVAPIAIEDLGRLGIDRNNRLFWDGRQVEIHQRLSLTGRQKTLAAIVTVCAILGGVGGALSGLVDASGFLCARQIHWLSCPAGR